MTKLFLLALPLGYGLASLGGCDQMTPIQKMEQTLWQCREKAIENRVGSEPDYVKECMGNSGYKLVASEFCPSDADPNKTPGCWR